MKKNYKKNFNFEDEMYQWYHPLFASSQVIFCKISLVALKKHFKTTNSRFNFDIVKPSIANIQTSPFIIILSNLQICSMGLLGLPDCFFF